jgi:DNA-binding LacI/PurR family transcriptional regulator
MAVSIKDIARVAGVSHSTVSRALRGSSLIPAGTTFRIQQIADELGYTASAIGRGLVSGRTDAIGVVVTSISDPFNGEVVAGLEEVANEQGLSVILATSQGLPEREISVVKAFQSRRVDGIVVASSRVGSRYSAMLADLQIPVVLLNNQHPDDFSYSVSIDNTRGAFEATNHLLQLGHRRIAYLGDRLGLHSDTERRMGFLNAMQSAGETVPAHFLLSGDGKLEGACQAAFTLLASKTDLPTALFCYNDMSAIGVMRAAHLMRIAIPEQLSIVGFDDIQVAELVRPALTTVRQPKRELGARSMLLMMKLLGGETPEKSVVLPGELIIRGSTASPQEQRRASTALQ